MKLTPLQLQVVTWAGLGITGLGLAYLVIAYAIPAFTKAAKNTAVKAAGDISSGVGDTAQAVVQGLDTNSLTKQGPETGFGGEENHDYTGYGLLSTPAAAANKATGGLLADAGDAIGGLAFKLFGSNNSQEQ